MLAKMAEPDSLDAGADVDLQHVVGIAGKAHFVAAKLCQATEAACADFGQQILCRHRRDANIPDPRRRVAGSRKDA